ncbi:EKC/KEOPS complex subunit LAGE3 isoform X2 [Sturnira hondurensis]|uniref:EKC/KEOPS complex subunit LAGE3 isoform X2 n=1 Tax=Sturnira hondurensis TaxID=192404 RepID=UPI00187A7B90|nr:EKC/KEOPS complex subunit LAGE3 isoform X2 [Sturnira hondurensis]
MVKFAPRGRGRRRSTAAMQAADAGTTGAQGLNSQDGYATPRGAGAVAAVAGGAPRAVQAQNASEWGGEAAVTADIARGSLTPDAEPHREAIRKELTVSGSVLAVCWRAEDAHLLRISIINFLDQLSLVMQTMQRFGPPLSR